MSKRWLVIVSLLAHGAILVIALVFNTWRIERLGIDYLPPSEVTASLMSFDPGGGSPPPAAAAKPETAKHDKPPTKHKAPVVTQPTVVATAETPPEAMPSETPGTGSGSGPGTGPGSGSGSGPGSGSGDPCPPDATCVDGQPVKTPPPPPPPALISPTLFKALRISGETQIVPPEVEQNAMVRDGRTRVTASLKLCIDRAGQVFGAAIIGSSRYPGYDRRLLEAARAWRYSPYIVNLQPTPACSAVTFIYTID